MFLQELQSKDHSLKPTVTRVRLRDGSVYNEKLNKDGTFQTEFVAKEAIPQFLSDSESRQAKLGAFGWSSSNTCWEKQASDNDGNDDGNHIELPTFLSLISYNVWFADNFWRERASHLFLILQEKSPDVICLQEVTPRFFQMLSEQKWVKENYFMSDAPPCNTVVPYGVCILTNKNTLPMPHLTIHSLPSNMGRRMIRALFWKADANTLTKGDNSNHNSIPDDGKNDQVTSESTCNGDGINYQICVGTAHLESLDNTDLRLLQLQQILPKLVDSSYNSFFLADTNFRDGTEESQLFETLPEWTDTWLCLGKDPNAASGPCMGGRYDKIFFSTQSSSSSWSSSSASSPEHDDTKSAVENSNIDTKQLQPVSIQQIGTESIFPDDDQYRRRCTFPSDHYGLHAIFKLV